MENQADITALELRHVSLAFEEKTVLSDISFKMDRGGTLFLLGVAGTGKSVLLKLCLGLLKPDAGSILLDGQDVSSMSEVQLRPIRKRVGMVFQEGALFDSLSVYENVAYPLREAGETDEEKIESRILEVLGFVEMEHAVEKMPAELSGGMRRRVSIARAIVNRPGIMLYDSPTAGLDPVTAHTIIVLIAKLRDVERVSSVVVTHRLQDAYALANFNYSAPTRSLVPRPANRDKSPPSRPNFLVLRDAGVYFQGSAEELARTSDPYLHSFLD